MRQAKKSRLLPADRMVLKVLLVLAALTGAVYLLSMAGLKLVEGALYVFLPLMLIITLVGWGLSAIARRFQKPVARRVAIGVAVVIMMGLAMLAVQYGAFLAGLSVPSKYAVMTAPGGSQLIVMRVLDPSPERIEARRADRLAADPDGDPEYTAADWGYTYTAYGLGPLGLFYRSDTLIDGAVNIGYASAGELMLEWEVDETVGHFYVRNPDVNDCGEMRARVK